ncbi:InlB B-repeat-containing protein [Feifania hominis]|uniref:S-layer homology domain-containing protein n=1 Tax=Feifania hominis TaxID=2763660 RepID=A0A926DBH2_9FIRM|nr:S-layer homology domain-containing protein [Feifania hominis]MBC8535930.1 S-layer homology domain-containing protein [Feifania hominis]
MSVKKLTAKLLIACMLLGLLPMNILAAPGGGAADVSEMNALEAIGIDTSVAPEGYDANDTSNPYGKDVTTVNPVAELLLMTEQKLTGEEGAESTYFDLKATLNGHADKALGTYVEFMADGHSKVNAAARSQAVANTAIAAGDGVLVEGAVLKNTAGGFVATAVAAGNFDGNTEGLEKQYALLSLKRSEDGMPGSLQLQVLDAYDGKSGTARAKTLVADFSSFGNPEDRAGYTYQAQNYLQMAVGDFDGNGIDEIAVYIPDSAAPRIEVYQYQQKTGASDTAYQDVEGNWTIAWNYDITKMGASKKYVPNMVSLLAGDINEDGIKDLALTYSYYYGTDNYDSGRAAVLFGGTNNMLSSYRNFPLVSSEGDSIVRAAFAFGELTGVGTNSLVLGGQSANDLAAGNIYSRYAAIYKFNGSGFTIVTDKNFDLFARNKQGGYEYACMNRSGSDKDIFYSSPLAVANLAVISNGLSEPATLYFDSLYFEYGDAGLELKAALDKTDDFQHAVSLGSDSLSRRFYTEYGAASADIFGLGYDALGTMQHFIPVSLTLKDLLPDYLEQVYSQSFDLSTQTGYGISGETYFVMAGTEAKVKAEAGQEGDAVSEDASSPGVQYDKTSFIKHKKVNTSSSFDFPNTDKDTAYLKYTGNHYFTYSNPEVLAVLASAPYFEDLLNRDDLSGNYAESTTSYAKTKSSGDGVTAATSISAGTYVSFEQDIKVFGITVASVEASLELKAAFTYEFEKTSTLEQSIEYSTAVGSDAVVLYSIPVVVYVYDAYTPNGNGGYDRQVMTITSPHTAAQQVMELDKYEDIARDYAELPQIAGNILTHTLGDPTTYPTSAEGYKNALVWDDDYAAVGYSGTGGGIAVTQSIDMSTEESHSFSGSVELETSAGAGAGGVVVGVKAGVEGGAGYVMTTTEGSTYTASMQNMPAEAEEFGYGLSWKLFAYEQDYYDGKGWKSIPVVNYLVTDVEMPPCLPTDFAQDVEHTTDDTVVLTWSYDKSIAGFQIYRYYEFPDGTGSYDLAFVPFDKGVPQGDGTWQFSYADTNLSPYTDYYYQIQAVRGYAPNNSIKGEVLIARTKTDVGYPELSLSGLDENGQVSLYPDSQETVTVQVANPGDYPQGINYQWKMLVNGKWTDVPGKTSPAYTFRSSGYSTAGAYRCRVNVIYWDEARGEEYLISAYTDTFDAVYSMRSAKVVTALSADVDHNGKPHASVSIESTASSHNVAPTGTVTFEITGLNYFRSYNVALTAQGKTATANLTAEMTSQLDSGVYRIAATYNGSRVFLPLDLGSREILCGDTGYRLAIYDNKGNETDAVVYGDGWSYKLIQYTKSGDGVTQTVIDTDGTETHVKDSGSFGASCTARLYRLGGNGVSWYGSGSGHYNGGNYDYGWAWYAETPARDYRLDVSYGGVTYQTRFSVTPRHITVGVRGGRTVPQYEVEDNMPELYVKEANGLVYGDALSAAVAGHTDFVSMHVYNTGGRDVGLDQSTLPGSYTVTGEVNPNNVVQIEGENKYGDTPTSKNGQKYVVGGITYGGNYLVTFEPATYIVTGKQFPVTAEVGTVNGNPAGTIELISPEAVAQEQLTAPGVTFSNGTSLLFLAKPYEGYQIKSWTVKRGDNEPAAENGSNPTLSCTMLSEPLHVALEFEVEQHKLTVTNRTPDAGSVVMPNSFANGATTTPGAELTFKAIAAEGYHFSHWEFVVGGSNTRYDGDEVTITMPKRNADLYPVFVRDSYVLTLADNLRASYTWDHDDNAATEPITRYVASGARIPGDTEVTVEAAPGYEIAADARWKVDGAVLCTETPNPDYDPEAEAGEDNLEYLPYTGSRYTFTLLKNTEVSTLAELGHYDLSLSTGKGTVTVVYGDTTDTVTSEEGSKTISGVPGATAITLTAQPDYGYVFDYWKVDGMAADDSGAVYNILKLSADTAVEAVFKRANARTVSGTFNALEGEVRYQVLDKNGTEQAAGEYTGGSIDAYDGDTVVIFAEPKASYMVGKWTVNGTVYDSDHSKTKRFESIMDDVVFDIDFVPQSYYTVHYSVVGNYGAGEGGTIRSATTDTVPFASGKTDVGGGSTVVITSEPAAGWMVKEWKIDDVAVANAKDPTAVYQGDVLTIDALSGNEEVVDITVEFQKVVSYDVTAVDGESWTVTWDNENDVRKSGDKVLQGETLVFTVRAMAGYRLAEVTAEGDSFDRIVDNQDGSKTCTVYALGDNLTVGARTKKLHAVTALEAVNGTVSAAPKIAAAGDAVVITVTPDNNYRLNKLTATYMDGENVEKLSISTERSFIMPDADVEVSATFERAGSSGTGGGGAVAPTYTVIVDDSQNGEVTANHSSASEGETVTLIVVADKGYELDVLTVTDEKGVKVKLTEQNGAFIFTMPASKVTVKAAFAQVEVKPQNPFVDVPDDAYFTEAVLWAVREGVTTGTSATTFSPDDSCTRAQTVTFLWRAAGSPAPMGSEMPFDDVPKTAYYYHAVLWAVEQGITSGTTATTFSPNATVTRAQTVTFLWRASGSEVIQAATPFMDVKHGMYYYNAVAWAVENDITSGTSQTTFSPTQNCTRAQIVTFLWRFMGK